MKNHALVPSAMVGSLSNLRHGGTHKILGSLLRDKLVSHDRSCGYDGYRLTNSGYDVLSLHFLKQKGWVAALGDRIGTGKESDVYVAASPEGRQIVLKIHRLGRTSFRDVKKKRDYFHHASQTNNSKAHSWLFLSKLSATKEYAYMKALHQVGFATPEPLGHNRHIVVMALIRGMPLYQVPHNRLSSEQKASIFQQAGDLAHRLLQHGLVHCDLNEFNLLVDLSGGTQSSTTATTTHKHDEDHDTVADYYVRHTGMKVETKGSLSAHLVRGVDGTGEAITEQPVEPLERLESTGEAKPIVTLIDFPQMVSVHHPNAEELYERDLECLRKFFLKKLKCDVNDWEFPPFTTAIPTTTNTTDQSSSMTIQAQVRLDQELQASGYSPEDAQRDVQLHYFQNNENTNNNNHNDDDDDDDESDSSAPLLVETDVIPENEEKHFIKDSTHNNDSHLEHQKDVSQKEKEEIIPKGIVNIDFQIDLSSAGQQLHGGLEDDESLAASIFTEQSYAIAEQRARTRVQHHLEQNKKSKGRKNAFKHRNSNKTYSRGKRIFQDHCIS